MFEAYGKSWHLTDYEVEEDEVEFDDLLYVSNRVYEDKTGENLPDSVYVTVYGNSGEVEF